MIFRLKIQQYINCAVCLTITVVYHKVLRNSVAMGFARMVFFDQSKHQNKQRSPSDAIA